MFDEEIQTVDNIQTTDKLVEPDQSTNALTLVDTAALQVECEKILNELITETDINKAKDLTYLFNLNQNKKTMVRVSKQSELLDLLTDKTIERVKTAPDNLSNDDLNKLMKTVSDLIEKGRTQINYEEPGPLIQVNQQNNEINMEGKTGPNHESREKVKNAILALLKNMSSGEATVSDIIDAAEVKDND